MITDEQYILGALRKGDENEFENLFRQYYDELCSYLNCFVNDHDEVEDLVQEVFANLWKQRENLPEIRSLKGYLYSSVKNKLLDYHKHLSVRIRAADRIKELSSIVNKDTGRNYYDEKEIKELLDNAISKLPPRRREVFVLVKMNGLSHQETADIMGINKKTIERQLSIAIKTLRKILTPFLK